MGLFSIDETGTIEGCLKSAKANIKIFEDYSGGEYRYKTAYVLDFARGEIKKAQKLLEEELQLLNVSGDKK